MQLITHEVRKQLLANNERDSLLRIPPVVKFFTPDAGCTWLISSMDDDDDTLFGLCDLGLGFPELGYVSLTELESVRGRFGLPVERDIHLTLDKPLFHYYAEAEKHGRITI